MLMIFPLPCPTAKGQFKCCLCRGDGKLNVAKDSHIFWHVVKSCPTPGGHHEGAVLLQTSFLAPGAGRGNSCLETPAPAEGLWDAGEGRAWAT